MVLKEVFQVDMGEGHVVEVHYSFVIKSNKRDKDVEISRKQLEEYYHHLFNCTLYNSDPTEDLFNCTLYNSDPTEDI
jgi:transcription termination factor NusB